MTRDSAKNSTSAKRTLLIFESPQHQDQNARSMWVSELYGVALDNHLKNSSSTKIFILTSTARTSHKKPIVRPPDTEYGAL